jgi:hypothetical protein
MQVCFYALPWAGLISPETPGAQDQVATLLAGFWCLELFRLKA